MARKCQETCEAGNTRVNTNTDKGGEKKKQTRNRLKASITSNKTLVPQTQCVSIFKHRREGRGWQNRFDSQFTCNISDSHTLGSCWAVLLGSGRGGDWAPCAIAEWGRAKLVRLIDQSQTGCQSRQTWDLQRPSSSYLCLLRRSLCVYWLGTTRQHQSPSKCQFYKKVEQAAGEVCPGSMDFVAPPPGTAQN